VTARRGRLHRWPRRLALTLTVALAGAVHAACAPAAALGAQAAPPRSRYDRRVEVVADRHQVSGGFGDWSGWAARLAIPAGRQDTWFAEALTRRAFRDAGNYVSLALQHDWSARLYSFVSIGGGSGDFVLPDLRVDALLSAKWGTRQSVVTTLGTTIVDAKLGYRDVGGVGSVTVYLAPHAIAEGGVRVTRSTPGDVDAARGTAALTLGRQGQAVVVLRGSSGREGFQLLGSGAAVRRFTSHEGGIAWRQWMGDWGGALLQGEHYRNPYYRRTGVGVGVFAHW
jgi:YaiO family outer membrane protein